jgi:RNA polymerase sigma-70 factor (ECF subfamily)
VNPPEGDRRPEEHGSSGDSSGLASGGAALEDGAASGGAALEDGVASGGAVLEDSAAWGGAVLEDGVASGGAVFGDGAASGGAAEWVSDDELARAFAAERPRLLRVAYATTGSLAESEDCVQEAWLRLRSTAYPVRNLRAWLTTTVGRLALDALGSARARRETYVGTWLPEPVVEEGDPADRVTLDESVSMALMVVLEQLSPAQRTAFLLHDVFGVPFDEVAGVVGRTPAAVRQLAARARRDVEQGRPRFPPTPDEQREVIAAFVAACASGDLTRLVTLLDPDVTFRGDGGGRVATLRRVERGVLNVARRLLSFTKRAPLEMRPALVNGAPGLVIRDANGILQVVSFTVDGGRVVAVDIMRNPDKLPGVS